jgi:L-2-hydroxyglutarate oxidase LhgO
MLKDYCAERGIAYEECGKVTVARNAAELPRLDDIEARATANGVPGLRRLSAAQLQEVEPHVRGISALHSPTTAIVDFRAVAAALAQDVVERGGDVRLRFAVSRLQQRGREVWIQDAAGEQLAFDRLVVCAGLNSDRLARMAGDTPAPWIIPFRGEYQRLVPERRHLVRGLIYPVPDPAYPFLGAHFTRRVDGDVDIGPNAVLALAREGYRRSQVSLSDIRGIVGSPGFRRLARRHWRMGLHELRGSLSRRAFVAQARGFVPELRLDDVRPAPAGVRAQAVDRDGSLVDDFRISRLGPIVVVRNAPSPAATSSLAIAEYIAEQVLARDGAAQLPL